MLQKTRRMHRLPVPAVTKRPLTPLPLFFPASFPGRPAAPDFFFFFGGKGLFVSFRAAPAAPARWRHIVRSVCGVLVCVSPEGRPRRAC